MSIEETFRPTSPTVADPAYPRLSCGLPFFEACANHVNNTFKAKRPYIIASNTLSKKTEFLIQLQNAIGSSLVGTWIGIPNHTPIDSVVPIINDMRKKEADCLITLGGGSISDGAKLISFSLANNVTSVDDITRLPRIGDDGQLPTSYGNSKPATIPVICIPISLSGAEYSRFAGAFEPATHFKYQFTHPTMFPSLVILDPNLTRSTPLPTWLASGVRSIDHCVEGFLSTNATDEGDKAAMEALPLLVNGLLRTKADPNDLDARLQCQLGSNLSLTLLYLGIKKGASHGIGHQLGPLGVAHGETSCILLPTICQFNKVVNGEKQEVLNNFLCWEELVMDVLGKAGVEVDKVDLGAILRAVFDCLGMPKTLKEVGVEPDKFEKLAEGCLKETYVISNPRPLRTKEDISQILNMVSE